MEMLGALSGILIDPDTGRIEGFFVHEKALLSSGDSFLSTVDILHWGARIVVRSRDVLAPVEERIRLRPLLASPRPLLGQRIVTEGGQFLGRCGDVQFSTKDFRIEWLFPRRWWRFGIPIPVSQIIDVRREAVVVRDLVVPTEGEDHESVPILNPLPDAA